MSWESKLETRPVTRERITKNQLNQLHLDVVLVVIMTGISK